MTIAVRARTRALDPEMRERRKFLARRLGGVDGEAARRQPVQKILGDGAKIARALEHQKFVPDLVRIDAAADAKARQRQRHFAQLRRQGGLHLEHGRRRGHILRHAVFDGGDRDHGLQVVAGPQQLEAKRQLSRRARCRRPD